MTEKRLNQIRQAEAEASPGPWTQTWHLKRGPKIWSEGKPILATIAPLDHCRITEEDPVPQWRKDLTFVRIARSAVPELLAENATLRARLEEAEGLLAETTDALFHAFHWADTEQMHEEVMEGRWDGVRAIVEKNERFLKEGK